LLDAVYDAPEDTSLRLVYADWLQEHGDPRGEFIITQFRTPRTPEQEAREAELLEAFGEAWQGKLGEVTTWAEFELGFLARCGLRRYPKWVVGRREWATVKHVGIADDWSDGVGSLITHAAMKSLISVRVSSRQLSSLLTTHASTRIKTLVLDGTIDKAALQSIAKSPVFATLVALDVKGGVGDSLLAFEDPIATRFESIAFEGGRWQFAIRRGDDGRLSALAIRARPQRWGREVELADLTKYFQSLPTDVLTALDLVLPKPKLSGLQTLKRAIARQKRVAAGI
jgi:uncharacterized protein (TIGR02996 family)